MQPQFPECPTLVSPRPTNTTRALSNLIAEADPSKIGESKAGKPSMSSESASTSHAKNDKGKKKRKRASEDENDMNVGMGMLFYCLLIACLQRFV